MRPGTEQPSPRARRKSSVTEVDRHVVVPAAPTTFFLASESDLHKAMSATSTANASDVPNSSTRDDSKASDNAAASTHSGSSLGEAFGPKNTLHGEDEREDNDNDGIYRLFRRKRKASKSDPSPDVSPAVQTARDTSETDVMHPLPNTGITNVSPTINASPLRRDRHIPQLTESRPLTPLMTGEHTPLDSGFPSTPKSGSFRSLRLSDEDDGLTEDNASQAIAPSDDEDGHQPVQQEPFVDDMGSSMPELVMPSLSMPSRRPFTARGRMMGRLKVCVAGAKGCGKTSLIRGIVQQCQDIVHVDPLTSSVPTVPTTQQTKAKPKSTREDRVGTARILQIQASTKAYPSWWSDMEESRILRRRRSSDDIVLERNLCFVDTPGLSKNSNASQADPVIQYIEALLHQNASISVMNDNDLLNVLTGNGGVQVDVVLYVFASPLRISEDIGFCRRLAQLTNIIPVITKVDSLSVEEIANFRTNILKELQTSDIRPFLFGKSLQEVIDMENSQEVTDSVPPESSISSSPPQPTTDMADKHTSPINSRNTPAKLPPFAVSTIPGSDDSEMDASLLMSSSYDPPLLPSELSDLITMVFEPEHMVWLRHGAVRKFLSWRDRMRSANLPVGGDSMHIHHSPLGITRALQLHQRRRNDSSPSPRNISPSESQTLVTKPFSSTFSPFNLSAAAIGAGLSDFTRARLRDHTLHEERLAQIQLTRWATDLQRSMQAERQQYESLIKGERAKWLLEKVGEEVRDGNVGLINTTDMGQAVAVSEQKRKRQGGVAAWAQPRTHRATYDGGKLPSWARPATSAKRRRRNYLDPCDPLGVVAWSDGIWRVTAKSLTVLGSGFIVGAAWLAVTSAWMRWNGRGDFIALQHPDGANWVAVGGAAPRWLGVLVAKVLWPGVEVRYM